MDRYEEKADAMTTILAGRTFSSEAEARSFSIAMIAAALREAHGNGMKEVIEKVWYCLARAGKSLKTFKVLFTTPGASFRAPAPDDAAGKCEMVAVPCPDNKPGCLVLHMAPKPCGECGGFKTVYPPDRCGSTHAGSSNCYGCNGKPCPKCQPAPSSEAP